jgi:hypothetical protein
MRFRHPRKGRLIHFMPPGRNVTNAACGFYLDEFNAEYGTMTASTVTCPKCKALLDAARPKAGA